MQTRPEQPHDHKECLHDALASAEEICAQRGLRLTQTRRDVLELIWSGHRAVKAYELLEKLSKPDRAVRPPTVYRALEFLLEHGFIHRIESLNAYIGCIGPKDRHVSQFLICTKCCTVIEMAVDALASLVSDEADNKGFQVARQVVEAEGLCSRCVADQQGSLAS